MGLNWTALVELEKWHSDEDFRRLFACLSDDLERSLKRVYPACFEPGIRVIGSVPLSVLKRAHADYEEDITDTLSRYGVDYSYWWPEDVETKAAPVWSIINITGVRHVVLSRTPEGDEFIIASEDDVNVDA